MNAPRPKALADADLRLDTVIRDALRAVRLHLDMPLSYLTIFENDQVRFNYTSTDANVPFLIEGDTRPAEGTFCKAVLDGNVPELLPDTHAHDYASQMELTKAGLVGSVVSIPIRFNNGRSHGMFCCLDHARRPKLNERDHAVMTAFGSLVKELLDSRFIQKECEQQIRNRIETIMNRRDFSLVHQPIVDLSNRSIVMFEALCRFGGDAPMPPDQVFAEARSVGLGTELELCIFTQTLKEAGILSEAKGLTMNLSPDAVMTDRMMDIVGPDRIDRDLVIELTEHVEFGDFDALADRLMELRQRGFRIAIDDFGNGHASLNAVLRLAPDVVKLDRALISRIETHRTSQSLVKAIATFSEDVGAILVAEGIEQKTQLDALRRLNINLGQGYYLGRPQAPKQSLRTISAA